MSIDLSKLLVKASSLRADLARREPSRLSPTGPVRVCNICGRIIIGQQCPACYN